MDWIILFSIVATVLHTEWRYRILKRTTQAEAKVVESFFRSRVSKIRMSQRSHKDPDVDFQPRTTKRDTSDIPKTGRMSRATVITDGGDLHDDASPGPHN